MSLCPASTPSEEVATLQGVYAILFTTFTMLIVFLISIIISKQFKYYQYFFIISWVIMEWLYSKWDLAFPWFNFGNVLGNQWYLIKWYSVTGIYGGTFWLLLVGLLFFNIMQKKMIRGMIIILIILFSLPLYSMLNYYFIQDLSYSKSEVLTVIPKKYNSNYYKTKKIFNYINTHNTPNLILTTELFYTELYPNQIKNGEISFF